MQNNKSDENARDHRGAKPSRSSITGKLAIRSSTAGIMLLFLVTAGCAKGDEPSNRGQRGAVQQTVEDVVTGNFKLYEGAKESLKHSENRLKEQAEQIEKELK